MVGFAQNLGSKSLWLGLVNSIVLWEGHFYDLPLQVTLNPFFKGC